ncbi:MAG TPA: ABC transporter substrate-binding protein [Burkholderiaceae bacterium]|nr:ABC transporter substrate-binding protein [Burkholderiaceae bacterium]
MLSRIMARALAPMLAAGAFSFAGAAHALDKVVLGFPAPPNVQFAFYNLGSKLGFFKEEGLQLEIISVTGSAVLLPQVATGQAHFGYANPDLAVIALAKGEPLPVRFVMNWLRSQTFEFVTLENSPIRTLQDLKGKRLGVGALTWGNIPMSRAMLASVGLAWNKDVQVLPIGLGAAAWRRLQTGEVDAVNLFVGEHGRMELAGIPIRRIPMPEQFRTIFSNGMVTSEKLLAERPQMVVGFGRALVKSWIACRENPEACVRAYWEAHPTARPSPDKEAEQLKTDMRQVMFDRNQIDDFSGPGPRKYGHFPEDAWKRLIDVMAQEGQIPRADLDLSRLYTNRFVDEINKFDMDAVVKAARAAR